MCGWRSDLYHEMWGPLWRKSICSPPCPNLLVNYGTIAKALSSTPHNPLPFSHFLHPPTTFQPLHLGDILPWVCQAKGSRWLVAVS